MFRAAKTTISAKEAGRSVPGLYKVLPCYRLRTTFSQSANVATQAVPLDQKEEDFFGVLSRVPLDRAGPNAGFLNMRDVRLSRFPRFSSRFPHCFSFSQNVRGLINIVSSPGTGTASTLPQAFGVTSPSEIRRVVENILIAHQEFACGAALHHTYPT